MILKLLGLGAAGAAIAVGPRIATQGLAAVARRRFELKTEEYAIGDDDALADRILQDFFSDTTLERSHARKILEELGVFANLFSGDSHDSYDSTVYEFFRQLKKSSTSMGVPFEVVCNCLRIGYRNNTRETEDGERVIVPEMNDDIHISTWQSLAPLSRMSFPGLQITLFDRRQALLAWISGYYQKRPQVMQQEAPRIAALIGTDPRPYNSRLPVRPWEAVRVFIPTSLFMGKALLHGTGISQQKDHFQDYPEALQASLMLLQYRRRLENARRILESTTDSYVKAHYQSLFNRIVDSGTHSLVHQVGLQNPPSAYQVVNYTVFWQKLTWTGGLRKYFLEDIDVQRQAETPIDPLLSASGRRLAAVLGLRESAIRQDPQKFVRQIEDADAIDLALPATVKFFREGLWEMQPEGMREEERKLETVKAFVKDQILNPALLEALTSSARDRADLSQISQVRRARDRFERAGDTYKYRETKAYMSFAHLEKDMTFQILVAVASIGANLRSVEEHWGVMDRHFDDFFEKAKEVALYTLGVALLFEVPSGVLATRGTVFAKNPYTDIPQDPEAILPPFRVLIGEYNDLQRRAILEQVGSTDTLYYSHPDAGFSHPRSLLESDRLSDFAYSFLTSEFLDLTTSEGGRRSIAPEVPVNLNGVPVSPRWWESTLAFARARIDEPPGLFSGLQYGRSLAKEYINSCLAHEAIQNRNAGTPAQGGSTIEFPQK